MNKFTKTKIATLLLSIWAGIAGAETVEPAWWRTGSSPIIDQNAEANDRGPVSIGQAKWVAKSALTALREVLPLTADKIEADLVGIGKPIPSFTPPQQEIQQWIEAQKSPLIQGQLKAIAAPFYLHLHNDVPRWLVEQRIENGTLPENFKLFNQTEYPFPHSLFPWTPIVEDDEINAIVTVGQLKAVFALRFETYSNFTDSDSDGLSDQWELGNFGHLNASPEDDSDGDRIDNLKEFKAGTNPKASADVDQDGFPDDWAYYYLNHSTGSPAISLPPLGDPDGDKIANYLEFIHGSNPRKKDTDGDGQGDWQEIAQGTNPGNLFSFIRPFEMQFPRGLINLTIPQSISNPTSGLNVVGELEGNVDSSPYELRYSNRAGGIPYSWVDIKSTGENLTALKTSSSSFVEKNLGFQFPFYGIPRNKIYISGDGFLTTSNPEGFKPAFPLGYGGLPYKFAHKSLISPFQMDLEPEVMGDIYFKASLDSVVVQWERVRIADLEAEVTFQVILYADGRIQFNYKSVPQTAAGEEIFGYLSGIQDEKGERGHGASWYVGSQQGTAIHSQDPLSIEYSTPALPLIPWISTSTTAGGGNPLSWNYLFDISRLSEGVYHAKFKLGEAGGLAIYEREIKLTVVPMGGDGNDHIWSNPADDFLEGGRGQDTYYYRWGDGNDTIHDDPVRNEPSILHLYDVSEDYLYFEYVVPNHLKINIKNPEDPNKNGSVLLNGWYDRTPYASKNLWRIFVQPENSTAAEITSSLRYLSTDGPDLVELSNFHYEAGLLYDSGAGNDAIFGSVYDETIIGGEGDDSIDGRNGDDTLIGGSGNDVLLGGDGNDELTGGEGEDTIDGGEGDNILDGGAGNDSLRGGYDRNDFVWARGGGFDVIDGPVSSEADNRMVLLDNLRLEDFNISRNGDSLKFILIDEASTSEGFEIKNWVAKSSSGLSYARSWEIVSAQGGTIIPGSYISTSADDDLSGSPSDDILSGGAGSDSIAGHSGNDILSGGDGTDTVDGGEGDDSLNGGMGQDFLYGREGNDVIIGGLGADYLAGGSGSDIYTWILGDGDDVIQESQDQGNINTLILIGDFDANNTLSRENVRLSQNSYDDAILEIVDPAGSVIAKITFKNWTATHLSWQLRFGLDGVSISVVDFVINGDEDGNLLYGDNAGNVINGLGGNDNISGFGGDDRLFGGQGSDQIYGGGGNNFIEGGDGDDLILIGSELGDNSLYGGLGNDTITGGAGHTTFIGGAGNDTLEGLSGRDVYIWNIGDGFDTIIDPYEGRLIFADGIIDSSVRLSQDQLDLVMEVIDHSGNVIGSVRILNWYDPAQSNNHWSIAFGNGITWDKNSFATSGNDVIRADETVLNIDGGPGDDDIVGGEGDDIMCGNVGNDILRGGQGNNQYIYNSGDGNDLIYNYTDNIDVLDLQGVLLGSIVGELVEGQYGVVFKITFIGTGESITIVNSGRMLIYFKDAIIRAEHLVVQVLGNGNAVEPGWHDTDGDGVFDDVESALRAFDSLSANEGDASIVPVADVLVDQSVLFASGNTYPTIAEALEAVKINRGQKPFVIIDIAPGKYIENLYINDRGVVLRGSRSDRRTIVVRESPTKPHTISGARVIFDGVVFGDGLSTLNMKVKSDDILNANRFVNCLFVEPTSYVSYYKTLMADDGITNFIHCTFFNFSEIRTSGGAIVNMVNSLFKKNPGSRWGGDLGVRQFGCMPETGSLDTDMSKVLRSDGMLKKGGSAAVPSAIDKVTADHRISNLRDIQGEIRDFQADIGCDEFVDSDVEPDSLPDTWELRWFGNQGNVGNTDYDQDGATNLQEYLAETDPTSSNYTAEQIANFVLSHHSRYGIKLIPGSVMHPLPASSVWTYSANNEITFPARQGNLLYEFTLAETAVIGVFIDAAFTDVKSGARGQGTVMIYLDDRMIQSFHGDPNDLFIPLRAQFAGTHKIEIRFVNPDRNIRPVVSDIAIHRLSVTPSEEKLLIDALRNVDSAIITLPSESLVSPVFIEGYSRYNTTAGLIENGHEVNLPIGLGPDFTWYTNVELKEHTETTVKITSGDSDSPVEAGVTWRPLVLGDVDKITIRKGDSILLQAASMSGSIEYLINGVTIGTSANDVPLKYKFMADGDHMVTARHAGNVIPNATTLVSVKSANFGPARAAVNLSTSYFYDLDVPTNAVIQGSSSLNLTSGNSSFSVEPNELGQHRVVARLFEGGPIMADGIINVFKFSDPGRNGGGRLVDSGPGRTIIDMSYSLSGEIPTNIMIFVRLMAGGVTFPDGGTTAWLSASDFDEYGVAHLQVVRFGGYAICQNVELFLKQD